MQFFSPTKKRKSCITLPDYFAKRKIGERVEDAITDVENSQKPEMNDSHGQSFVLLSRRREDEE